MVNDKYDPTNLTRGRYKVLLHKEAKLDALEAGGVDNWEWYEESLNDVVWP